MAWLVIHYPRAQVSPDAPDWTLAHALDVAGVPAEAKAVMLAVPLHEVRNLYSRWLAETWHKGANPVQPVTPEKPPVPKPNPPVTPEKPLVRENPDWFKKTCADLAPKVIGADSPQHVLHAVVQRASTLWDNNSVGFVPSPG